MRAAAAGEGYHMSYGDRLTFNYTADVARALVAMSRASCDGAAVFNMPGTVASLAEVVAAIERAAPDAAGRVTCGLAAVVGELRVTPLEQAVAETIEHYRRVAS